MPLCSQSHLMGMGSIEHLIGKWELKANAAHATHGLSALFAGASNFSIEGSTFIAVNGDMHQVVTNNWITHNPSPIRPNLNINDILRCPPPSKDFVGRENILQNMSKIFAAPVVSIICEQPQTMNGIVSTAKLWPDLSVVIWDASSEDGLEAGHSEWSLQTDQSPKNRLLILENADSSLDLEAYIPYSLNTHLLILSTNDGISALASGPGCIFTPESNMNKRKLREFVTTVRKAFAPQQHIAALVARGGTGKTQVARKFFYDYGERFLHHWVIDAFSESTILANFKALGNAANTGNEVQDVCQFLENTTEEWLLIFDNADHGVDLAKYIPHCNHGSILITSRDRNVNQLLPLDQPFLDLPDLTEDEAISLLLKSAHQKDSEETHLAIVHALGSQALAIVTAGTYVSQHPTCQLKDYLKVFNQKRDALLKYQLKTLDRYDMTILVAFHLSFDFLSGPSQSLMQICSLFHHVSIPMEIFYRGLSFTLGKVKILPGEEEAVNSIAEKLKSFLEKFSNHLDLDASINELARMSLADYSADSNGLISFHPVVHHCAHETRHRENLDDAAIFLLAFVTPGFAASSDDSNFQHHLFPHACHVWDAITRSPPMYITQRLSCIFSEEGQWFVAERMQKQVIDIAQTVLGEQDLYTSAYKGNLAITYTMMGRYNDAQVLQEEVVKVYKARLGKQHVETLISMNNLAFTLSHMGRYNEAELLSNEVVQVQSALHGEQNPHTLTAMNNLAWEYTQMGRYNEAELLGKKVIDMRKAVLGERHPDTLSSMSNLAFTYTRQGRYNEAEALGKEVIEIEEHVLGRQHPKTLTSLSNLAVTYHGQGRYDEAEVLGKEVLQLRQTTLEEKNPDTLTSISILASILSSNGKYSEAEAFTNKELQLSKAVLGEQHPDTLSAMSHLAGLYSKIGRYNEAEKLAREALQIRQIVLGRQHPDTLGSMADIASICCDMRRFDEAEVLRKEVLQIQKSVLGERHPETLTSMSNLATLYHYMGKNNESEVIRKEELQLSKVVLGEQHPDTIISLSNLVMLYSDMERYNEAEVMTKEVLENCKIVLGEQHPGTLKLMANLVSIYYHMGRYKETEALAKEVLQARRAVLGAQHPDTLISLSNLADTYSKMGKYNDSEILGKEGVRIHKNLFGEQHAGTLTSMSKLASAYFHLGKYNEAEALMKGVLLGRKDVLGEQHPDTLVSMSNLTKIYLKMGRYNDAEVLGKEEVQIHKTLFGEQHVDTFNSMSKLASAYYHIGKYSQAEEMAKEVLLGRKLSLGSSIATLWFPLGKEAVQFYKIVLGDQHFDTLASMSKLSVTYFYMKRYKEAEALIKEVLHAYKSVHGEEPDILKSMLNFLSTSGAGTGASYEAQKNWRKELL
ncbi:hypothetical protein BDP27DRAFT_1433239 [Rhodocollybia butyracea]|uniref:NB-ARC domain-containing protein n=1 Tax=Rhodocollybia butyracea TaxID=206335 RepID=A0A9P5P3S7_9AGAR|nr:hypothetical protein BDP27DRAFT_1433239 [Rhodocollybia butyracea]